jgi:tetratricopeptide (TPR) repeat protein
MARGHGTIADYLETKRLTLKDGKYTVDQALEMVLDSRTHRIAPDIGLADGTPTITPAKTSGDEPAEAVIEVYDLRQEAARLKGLTRNYGAWRNIHGSAKGQEAGVMLYDVIQRLEQLSSTRMLWAESVDKQAKLGVEIRENDLAGIAPNADATCAAVLGAVTEKAGLRFRIVGRDLGTKFYEDANKAFNEARKIDPTGKYAEKALFAVAVNYYNLRDYLKMKQVLKTYLQLFDNPDNETYQQACFWIGYALEMEKKPREAVNYYARAAEERLVIAKAAEGGEFSPQKLKEQLSYDSQFALSEPLRGKFEGMSLSQFADFVQVNTHVGVRIDPAIATDVVKIDRPAFKDTSGLALLADVLRPAGLTCRAENVNAEVAEKAYFRMAAVYKRDNLMEQALENCNLLLSRYPGTERRRDVSRLMLDIHKGMGDYAKVIVTLEELRKTATDAEEKRDLDLEMAAVYFDMADYDKSAAAYKSSLSPAKGTSQSLAVREGYARSLVRLGKTAEALAEYQAIAEEETGSLASFVDSMIVFQLNYALGRSLEREFPEDALKYVLAYEKLSDQQQERMSNEQKTKITWIYYVLGMVDLDKKRIDDAVAKLSAARNSPDDALAGEAAVRVGMVFVERGEWVKAREAFETLLFQARASDARVRGTYWLGVCLEKLGDSAGATKRFTEVVTKYPASPYAGRAREHEANKEGK